MRQGHHVLAAALLFPLGLPALASAGQRDQPRPLLQQARVAHSQIVGTVRDEAGLAVSGASVLALGTTLAAARSDVSGHFSMLLPAGEYVLRAIREGYVSTYREAVRVEGDALLRRTITLLKVTAAVSAQPGSTAATPGREPNAGPETPGPTDVAWRLRHLPRSVLRDHGSWQAPAPERVARSRSFDTFEAFWDGVGLTGSLDLMTTSSFAVATGAPPANDIPRGVAYVVVGAPVGQRGDWTVRAALAPDEASSWTFVGEYQAKPDRPHRFRTGVTYSAQRVPAEHGGTFHLSRPDDVLRVGGVYARDEWSIRQGLELSYSGRFDRFDYLPDPNLFSGSARLSEQLVGGLGLFAAAARHRVAPGADQFQPPSAAGAWLPPDRTFSALDSPLPLAAATVDRRDIGMTWSAGRDADAGDDGLALGVSHFVEQTTDQIVTAFNLDPRGAVGHYHVGVLGHPRVEGVTVELAGAFGAHARGRVAYSTSLTTWDPSAAAFFLPPSRLGVAMTDRRGHDLSTALEGNLPRTDTLFTVVARVNDWYGDPVSGPGVGARFAIEVQQPLPLRGFGGEGVTLVLGARNLLGDASSGRGYYDDLVTVEPPLRLTCGIQMRF